MECPARRLIDTQYSCAAEGRTDQQPWQNALYRVNTLLLNHKTVELAQTYSALKEMGNDQLSDQLKIYKACAASSH